LGVAAWVLFLQGIDAEVGESTAAGRVVLGKIDRRIGRSILEQNTAWSKMPNAPNSFDQEFAACST
jgi:hypothetical protein